MLSRRIHARVPVEPLLEIQLERLVLGPQRAGQAGQPLPRGPDVLDGPDSVLVDP